MTQSTQEELTLKEIHRWLGARPHDAHKGLFGHVVVVGGDDGMPGAVRLAAEGALRIGAGRVTVITHKTHQASVTNGRPELICYGVESIDEQLTHIIKKATVIALGPGLGQNAWSQDLFDYVIQQPQPKVIDADGLNWLAQSTLPPSEHWVLTPHPGEAARLLNCTAHRIQHDRKKSAMRLVKKYHGVVVLKGAQSIIASHTQFITCPAGNPGMASPGMGDLLTGLIAGLIAQGLSLEQAAQAGVYIHATAGDLISDKQGQRGLLASDLLAEIPRLVNDQTTAN